MSPFTRMIEYLYEVGNPLKKSLNWLDIHKKELILTTTLPVSGAYAPIGYSDHPAIVREVGAYGNQLSSYWNGIVKSQQMPAETVSVPVEQLCLPEGGCERISGFDDNSWSLYAPNIPDRSNLKNIVDGRGYFVKMSRDNKLPDGTQMKDGWNTFSLNPHQIGGGTLNQAVASLHRTGAEFTISLPDGTPLYNSSISGVFPTYSFPTYHPDSEIDPNKAYWLSTNKGIDIEGAQGITPARIARGLNLVGGDMLTPRPIKVVADGSKIPLKPRITVDVRSDGYILTETRGLSDISFQYRKRVGGDSCFLVVEKGKDYRDYDDNGCDGYVDAATVARKDQQGNLRGVYVSRHGNDGLFIKEIDPEYVTWLERLGLLDTTLPPSFKEKIGYFLETAIGAECGGEPYIKKWAAGNSPKIRVHGSPTDKDMDALRGVIDELRGLTRLDISLVQEDGKQNVDIYFVPALEFPKYIPPSQALSKCMPDYDTPSVSGTEGLAWVYGDNHIINRGKIVIDTGLMDLTRRSVTLEELTHLIGLMNHSERYRGSILFQNASDVINYDLIDETVIRLLYSDEIKHGMSREQLLNIPILKLLSSMRPLSDTSRIRK